MAFAERPGLPGRHNMVCHPKAREIVMFWEGYDLPILGKRGHRELPCPQVLSCVNG
jgi:hypothetical protein